MPSSGVTADVDMKDVELNEVDVEKQPMNTSPPLAGSPGSLGEKNGVVKVKVAEEDEDGEMISKFTGLSKEELLQVAGTPGWVRTRWLLLILFWLGWLGMLAGAIVIIVQAPHCKELPTQNWWQKGGLYRIQAVEDFQDSDKDVVGDLEGLKQRMDYLGSLKLKGLVIGPLHVNDQNLSSRTNLQEIDPKFGTLENFLGVLAAAKKKSLKIVLDLTPNYNGDQPWFNLTTLLSDDFQTKMKAAVEFWLKKGVSGIQIRSVEHILNNTNLMDELKNLTRQYSDEDHSRVLIATTDKKDLQGIFSLLNESKADLLTNQYMEELEKGGQWEAAVGKIQSYVKEFGVQWPAWSMARPQIGDTIQLGEQLLRLYHMLFYTMPGTPFTEFGDEIGLRDLPGQPAASKLRRMRWDSSSNFGFSQMAAQPAGDGTVSNVTVQAESKDPASVLTFFRQLSELRGKERSLLHGDFSPANSSNSAVLAYLRIWDQNKRFLVLLNFAPQPTRVTVTHPHLPPEVTLELGTHPQREKTSLKLQDLELGPSEGLLLSFPYVA